MNSGREVIFGLRIAGAAGYLDAERVAKEVDSLDRIVATSTSSPTGRSERCGPPPSAGGLAQCRG